MGYNKVFINSNEDLPPAGDYFGNRSGFMTVVSIPDKSDLPDKNFTREIRWVLVEDKALGGVVKPISNMEETYNFGVALDALKNGQRVARTGWNGKGMFLFLLPAGQIPKAAIHDSALRAVINDQVEGDTFEALGTIRMWTADKKILTGWLASQTDMLAEDWVILK